MTTEVANEWSYPRWVAHRGAGKLAPENTLAAFKLGASHGYTMFECDVKLSADGVPFLLHDDTLERTTNGRGAVPDSTVAQLARLDAGAWRDQTFAGEPVPDFDAAAALCLQLDLFCNVEIKPWAPGGETVATRTGQLVAAACARHWRQVPAKVLLSSFSAAALAAARARAPQVSRAYLCDDVAQNWRAELARLECVALHCNAGKLTADLAHAIKSEGFGLMCWTVNDTALADTLFGWGVDAICTDRLDLFAGKG